MSVMPLAAEVGQAETKSERDRPLIDLDEDDLLASAQSGEATAFDEIYLRHSAHVRNYASRMVRGSELDDVVQEVFTRAWLNLNKIEGRGYGIKGWLFRVAHNLAISETRRESRMDLFDISPDAETRPDDDVSESAKAIGRLTVMPFLQKLTPEQKEAVIVVDLLGHTPTSFATEAHIGISAAKSRLDRGRKTLRRDRKFRLLIS